MPRRIDHVIKDILAEIAFVRRHTRGLTLETFAKAELVSRAVERSLEKISEGVRHLPADKLKDFPNIPWKAIKAFGNVLRHEYHRVDPAIVWETLNRDLVPLASALRSMKGAPSPKRLRIVRTKTK